MTTISDLNAAVLVAEDWINDLMRRLGWQDRERVYLALLATCTPCVTVSLGTKPSISARSYRRCCVVSITKAGIPARGRP